VAADAGEDKRQERDARLLVSGLSGNAAYFVGFEDAPAAARLLRPLCSLGRIRLSEFLAIRRSVDRVEDGQVADDGGGRVVSGDRGDVSGNVTRDLLVRSSVESGRESFQRLPPGAPSERPEDCIDAAEARLNLG
jgi:hypothetical protein